MEQKYILQKIKFIIFFLTLLFCSVNSNAQTSGPFIPYVRAYPDATKGDPSIIRGTMVIISNSILGVDENGFEPNDEYDLEVNSSAQRRAYIDIDSDPNKDTKYVDGGVGIFDNLPASESEYAGMPLADGTPTVSSTDPSLLTNGQPLLDDFGAPNYGLWVDNSIPSIEGPFLVGSEQGTFSSSSADLKINSSPNSCSTIQRAYLYWAGLYTGEQFIRSASGGAGNFATVTRNRPDCVDENGVPCELYTDIKILPPNASKYIDIKFTNSGADENSLKSEIVYDDTWSRVLRRAHSIYNKTSTVHPGASFNSIPQNQGWQGHPSYACRADITSLMQSIENSGESVEGFWTVANIRSTVGQKFWGLAAGWSIAVVYEDPLAPQKYISLFDGYVNVNRGEETTTISGFETVPTGPVNVEFASLSLEGDVRLPGDNFRMNGTNISASKPAGVTSNIGYDSTNYFDSSILSVDNSPDDLIDLRRYPHSLVNLGFDADHFVLDNSGNSIIDNGDTSADIIVTAPGNDQTSTYFTAFCIEVIAPDLVVTKLTFREDGTPIEIGNDIVDLGDKIVYEITIENIGNEEAVYTQFQDLIPINTLFNFDESNFSFNNTPLSASEVGFGISDSGEVDGEGNPITTTLITYNIDDSVDTNGNPDGTNGLLEPGESVELSFTVQVVTDCSFVRNACSGFIENQADVTYSTLLENADGSINTFEIKSAFDVDACDIPDPAPTPFLADQAECFITAEPISQCQEFISLFAGLGFDEYIWTFDDGTGAVAFNTDANGDPTLNQDSIVVDTSGTYDVREILTTTNDCQNITLSFDVEALDSFDPGIDPFADIDADFVIENDVCPDTNISEITTILLCEGAQTIGADTFPAGTTFSWQELNTDPGCSATSSDCPFISSTGSSCYDEFSTSNIYEFDRAGDFRLTLTLDGGCPFNFYFTTVEFNVNPLLSLSSGGGCAGAAELEVTNIPANYTVEFTDSDGNILQADSTATTYTLNPPADFSTVVVTATVLPDVDSYDGCVFSDDLVVSFSDLNQTALTIEQPTCFQDQDSTDTIDNSKGQIFIQVDGATNYTYELVDTSVTPNVIVSSEINTTSNNHDFENVNPGTYNLIVYSDNYPISGQTTPTGCFLTESITIEEFAEFDVDLSIVQFTCEPAQINFDLDSDETTPDYSLFTTRLNITEGTTTTSYAYTGETGSILIADTLNNPSTGEDDLGNTIPDDGVADLTADIYIDDLYTNGATLTLEVFKTSTGSCSIERTITINPYTPLTLAISNPIEPSCSGEADGQVTITPSGDNIADISTYEITSAPSSYTGTTTNTTATFTQLTAGEYTFTVTQSIDGDNDSATADNICTTEITYDLEEPDPITTPVIEIAQTYTCETTEGHITLTNASSISGGTTPYTYRLLKYATEADFNTDATDGSLDASIDTRSINDITLLPYESLTDGSYVLEIEDNNFCTSTVSNVITFIPLSVVTLSLDDSPLLTCDSTTTTITVSATATNSGVIEGYSIINVTDPSVPAAATDYSLNTIGEFALEPGDYEITSRTSTTLCVSNILEVTIDPVINIDGTKTGGRETLTCIGDNDGSTSYSLSGIGANGYSYSITRDTAAYTPVATNPQPNTNLTATNFLLENLEIGAYEITFTDAFTNCTDVVTFSISNPPAIILSEAVAPQYNCNATGLGTYTFQVSAMGGTGTISFSDGTTTSASGQFTINATTAAQTITITATDGNTCAEDIDINIPATNTLLVTSPIIQCIENGNNDVVTVTFSGATGTIQYKEDGAATFTTATISGSTFDIDTNKTIGGTYTYLIVDTNNNESCARELEVTFYDDIDISNLSTTTLSCNSTGTTPTTGASITFEVDGGVGAYTYTFETSSISATALTPDSGSTDANPTFTFDDSFDEELITITIANTSGCGVPTTVNYTPNYPEVPTVDTIDIPVFICDSETKEVTITPNFEAGETINSFTYIFDGIEQFSNSKQYTEGTTAFTYAIKRTSTGCISPTQNGTLNSVDPIRVTEIVKTDEMCNTPLPPPPTPIPSTKGTARITISNGTGPFDVTATNLDDSSLAPYFLDDVSSPAFYSSLEMGNYLVEITDANGCILTDRVEFKIIPEPNVQFDNEQIIADCINKVTYFFEVLDGSGPANFIIGLNPTSLVDPTTFGDDISNYNDVDFPIDLFNNEQTPAEIASYSDLNRVYAITRLEFDQAYTVFVQDTATTCFSSANVDAVTSTAVDFTSVNTINTGACALNSGEVEFTFDLGVDGLPGTDYVAEIIETDGTVDTSITPVTVTSVTTTGNTGTLVGLPAGSHILRIRPEDTTNECSGTADFTIGTEPAMGPLEIAFSRGSSCNEAAQLELRVSGGGGRTPYQYLLMPTGNTPDDSTIFTETATISETTILSFTDATGTLIADAFVKDASGCISEALVINKAPLVEPTLNLDLSPQDCDDTGLFTTNYTIGNHDISKSYTFTVNGDVPGNAQITITDPDASGEGTVSAQNRDTYTIEVTASDNPSCPATDTFELAEDVINIQATLDDSDCDGLLDFITVEVVDGGYDGIPTRQLIYEVYQGSDITGTLIATSTPAPISTSLTFNAGTNYGSGALSLSASTDYSVRVIDIYDAADPAGRQCNDVHEGLSVEPVDLPDPVTVAETELTCSSANDGQIELGITGTSANINYRLFQFANATDAANAITADTVVASGTEIASNTLFTEGNIFSNLQGAASAAYVGVVNVTSLSCPIYSAVIDLDEPDDTPTTAFVIAGIDGNCDNTDLVTDALPQLTIQIAATLPSAITDYQISISPSVGGLTNPFTFADLSLVGGTTDTYTIDANSIASQAYTISISDINTTCNPLEYTQTVFCDTEIDQLGVVVTSPAIPCFDVTATSTVSFEVTAANGNPLLFDYTITTKNDPSTILDFGTDETTSPIIVATGLTEGEYILNVKDNNETRIPPVVTEFEIEMPDSLPNFSLNQGRTGCDTVEITATPVNASGTPNITDPAYTFEISADGTTFTSMTPTVTGTATATVTAPSTGMDTYTIRITDANSCPNTNTIEVIPQEQLAAAVAAGDICLNEGDANALITITTGTPPFSYVRTNTGTGNTEMVDNITNSSFPIEIEDTITTAGDYEYVVTDSFGCTSAAFPITIENALTLSVIPVPASTACDNMNNPESSEYQLTIAGGTGSYTYEVAIGETAINTNNFVSYAGPNYTVDISEEGERFVFRVSDGLGCTTLEEPALITFPTFPEVTFSDINDIECPGANGSAVLTVTSGTGKAPYEVFVTETGNAFPTTALAGDLLSGITYTTAVEGTFDYKVVDINGCESAVGSFAISNSVIVLKNFDIQDITCTSAMPVDNSGSITLSVSNAETDIVFTLFEDGNPTALATHTESVDDEHTFDMLTAGDYIIEVTDANNCATPFEFEATVNTNTDIVIGDYQVIDEDCTTGGTGITIAFPVDGIPTILIEDPLTGLGVVDPTSPGDNLFKYDDALDPFPNTIPPTTLGADDKFYVVTNLAADTEYTIIAQDDTGCQTQRIFTTPANDAITNLTADTVPESICITNDGEIAVNFEIGTSLAASFDVYLFNEDESLELTSVLGVSINAGSPEATFTGLTTNDYVVRVTEAGESLLCGNPIEAEVESAPDLILDMPSFAAANCTNTFIVPITASAQFGVPPYEFDIVPSGGTPTYPGTTLEADTAGGTVLNWEVYVQDSSGCVKSSPITIIHEPIPAFVIDPEFSVDQCENAVASYTVTGTITNYDSSLEPYTYTLNGTSITPTSAVAGSLVFEVPNRATYTIEVFDKNGCDDGDTDTITIYDLLEATITLSDVDCNGEVTTITANVIGGYNEPTRSLDYVLYAANDLAFASPIVSQTGTTDIAPMINVAGLLSADTDYVVVVTDSYTNATPTMAPSCSAISNVVSFEEIEKSSIKAAPQDVTCNGATDGIILIEDITVGEIPVTYELYSYASLADAQTASTNNDPTNGATLTATAQTANVSNEQLFENLPVGFYTAFVRNGSIACFTASEAVEISEPVLFTGTGLTATAIQADCATPTQAGIEISITVASLDGEAPYYFRVPGVVDNFTEITDISIDNTFNVSGVFNTNTSYNVEFTDASGITCVPAITIPLTIDPFTANPNLDLLQTTAYSCATDESVTLEITNRAGTEAYTFTNTLAVDFDGNALTALTATATTVITADFLITEPGRYIFQATSDLPLGCESNEFEYIVRELDQLRVEATGSIAECFGDTSTIEFEVLDYTGAFDYTYSYVNTGGTTITSALITENTSTGTIIIPALDVNTYTINVTAGTLATCQNTALAQIVGPDDAITITSAEAITDITCLVDYAEVQIIADGGFGNYEYEISGGTLASPVTNNTGFFDLTSLIGAGNYTVSVTDEDNPSCTAATTPLTIDAPVGPELVDDLGPFNILCYEGNIDFTVSLSNPLLVTANTDDLRYSLFTYDTTSGTRGSTRVANQAPSNSGETFVMFTGIEAGDYLAEVSDIFGCVYDIKPIEVAQPDLLELNANVSEAFSCDNLNMEEWTAAAQGGRAPYLYTLLSVTDTQLNTLTASGNVVHNGNGVFNIVPFRIVTVQVTDDNGCITTTVMETGKTLDPIEFNIESNSNEICFGETEGFVKVVNDLVTGGEGNYVYSVYESNGTTLVESSNTENLFTGLVAGDYVYEVSSNNCAVVSKTFTIEESPEIVAIDNSIPVSCRGADDAVISITIDENVANPFDKPVSFSIVLTSDNGSPTASFTIDKINDPAEFDGLAPGTYTWTIINNNSIGCFIAGATTIDGKTDITVDNGIFDNEFLILEGGICEGDIDGTIQMFVEGGSRTLGNSYYYAIRTDFSDSPDVNAIKTLGNELIPVPGDTTGNLFTVAEVFDTDVAYEIIIIDEGNGLTGNEFDSCINIQDFIFETEDLDNFEVSYNANCDTLGYTISVDNNSEVENPEELVIFVYNAEDGSIAATGGAGLDDVNVNPGTYVVEIGNTTTTCTSQIPQQIGELPVFEPVSFVEENDEGEAIQPFIATNELNIYVLQATGGLDPTAGNAYRFEGLYTDLNGNVNTIEVEDDGTFEITSSGAYVFTLYDNIGEDGNGCFDVTSTIGLTHIDIDIPNVFNPTSNASSTNTWFPDNLTSNFGTTGASNPITDPDAPQIPTVFETVGGVLNGGTTVGGTTTDGVTIGGDITSSGTTTNVDTIPTGTSSVTYVTVGGTTTNGVTTGGYIIRTTTTSTGNVNVEVLEGTITGGTTSTNGVVTGGLISSEALLENVTPVTGVNGTTFTVTTEGSTTGGTTTGGTTTGGITVGSNTTEGTTTNATTTNGTTMGGSTIVITFDNAGITTINYLTNTIIEGGTTTNGATTGGTITGGSLSGGTDTPIGIEFLDYENMEVMVFDRYGRLLDQFKGIQEKGDNDRGWDGTYDGKEMPSGDYWYVIKLNDTEGREFTGHFTLYRR